MGAALPPRGRVAERLTLNGMSRKPVVSPFMRRVRVVVCPDSAQGAVLDLTDKEDGVNLEPRRGAARMQRPNRGVRARGSRTSTGAHSGAR